MHPQEIKPEKVFENGSPLLIRLQIIILHGKLTTMALQHGSLEVKSSSAGKSQVLSASYGFMENVYPFDFLRLGYF
jgi:hypothetical protein